MIPSCPESLNDDHRRQFAERGFLAFANAWRSAEVERAREALRRWLRTADRDTDRFEWDAGEADGTIVHAPTLRDRESDLFVQLEPGSVRADGRDVSGSVRKLMSFCSVDSTLDELSGPGSRLATLCAGLLDGPVDRFQDMSLLKPALCGGEKPWHQDAAYFSILPLDAVVGVWIALEAADADNGCMHIVPGAHRHGPLRHRLGVDCEIDPSAAALRNCQPIPLQPGGVLLFSSLLPHQTPPNASDRSRWAVQFHYRRTDSEVASVAEYDRVFLDADQQPASCAAAKTRDAP